MMPIWHSHDNALSLFESAAKTSFPNHCKHTKKINVGCTQSVCLKCCTDLEGCSVHKEQRDQAAFREQVINGTTDIQRELLTRRSKIVLPGRFREPGFAYMGDTVVIWNLREYLANPKWKEEALRKSAKRRVRNGEKDGYVLKNSRKRFRRIIQSLYEASLDS